MVLPADLLVARTRNTMTGIPPNRPQDTAPPRSDVDRTSSMDPHPAPGHSQPAKSTETPTATPDSASSLITQELLPLLQAFMDENRTAMNRYDSVIHKLIKENFEMHRKIAALEARLASLESRHGDTGEAPKPADACLQASEPTTASPSPSGPHLPAADDTAKTDVPADTRPSYAAAAAAAPNPSAPVTPDPNPIAHPAFGARPRRQNAYTNVYARLSIPAELPRPRHREFVRQALQAIGAGDGIAAVSPVGRSVVHLLVSNRYLARTTTALIKMDALLSSFDPLAPPPHVLSP
ncbi:hypothetical protein HDU96_010443, partial [Phlyctochytrium bullatum]